MGPSGGTSDEKDPEIEEAVYKEGGGQSGKQGRKTRTGFFQARVKTPAAKHSRSKKKRDLMLKLD